MLTMQEQREQNEWFEDLADARTMAQSVTSNVELKPYDEYRAERLGCGFDPHALAMALQLADLCEHESWVTSVELMPPNPRSPLNGRRWRSASFPPLGPCDNPRATLK